ncbi:hypothetical protein D3C73_1049920 [compost metagenome]
MRWKRSRSTGWSRARIPRCARCRRIFPATTTSSAWLPRRGRHVTAKTKAMLLGLWPTPRAKSRPRTTINTSTTVSWSPLRRWHAITRMAPWKSGCPTRHPTCSAPTSPSAPASTLRASPCIRRCWAAFSVGISFTTRPTRTRRRSSWPRRSDARSSSSGAAKRSSSVMRCGPSRRSISAPRWTPTACPWPSKRSAPPKARPKPWRASRARKTTRRPLKAWPASRTRSPTNASRRSTSRAR